MLSIKTSAGLGLLLCYFFVVVVANTKYVKILPSDAKYFVVKPSINKLPISHQVSRKYWISGTFFNKENFQGLPMSFYFSGSKCINMFGHKTTLSSLKPTGCVMLHASKDCQGPYAVVTKDMANLNTVGIENSIGSITSCPAIDDSWKPRKTKPQSIPN